MALENKYSICLFKKKSVHLPILTIQQCLNVSSYFQNTLWKTTPQHKALCGRHKKNQYLLSFDTSSFIKKVDCIDQLTFLDLYAD